MFRKITSNRNPKNTIWSEIHNEFSRYTNKLGNFLQFILGRYPNAIFCFMIAVIVISLAWVFFARKEPVKKQNLNVADNPISNSMGQIFGSISDLKEIIELQAIMDVLSKKEKLEVQDSLILVEIKERLFHLENIQKNDTALIR
ncbi:conserved hypothetical protein [Sphingobacterium sp. PM2-P1-29]|nr:conserved hypothetical protein [Sphingobacterium sp. PM2-P1-29]